MRKGIARMACCLAAAALLLCGCENKNETGIVGGVNDIASTPTQSASTPVGIGFRHAHAVEAGFGLYTDTADDVTARMLPISQPTDVKTQETATTTITTVTYPFGIFEFQSEDAEGVPTLCYVDLTGVITGPCGVTPGMSLSQAAELVYSGSAEQLGDAPDQEMMLYGESDGLPRGRFYMLTAEYTSTSTPELYALEYFDEAYEDNSYTRMTLYFNSDYIMTRYELRCVRSS